MNPTSPRRTSSGFLYTFELNGAGTGYQYSGYGYNAGGTAITGIAAIPEPCTLMLLSIGTIGLLRRRNR